jgi:hypothetical protein
MCKIDCLSLDELPREACERSDKFEKKAIDAEAKVDLLLRENLDVCERYAETGRLGLEWKKRALDAEAIADSLRARIVRLNTDLAVEKVLRTSTLEVATTLQARNDTQAHTIQNQRSDIEVLCTVAEAIAPIVKVLTGLGSGTHLVRVKISERAAG